MEKSLTSSEYFKKLQFLHALLSLLALLVVVLGLVFFTTDANNQIKDKDLEKQIIYYIAGFTAFAIVVGKWLMPFLAFPFIKNQQFLKHKLSKYSTVLKVQFYIFFFALILSFVPYLLWANYIFLVFSFVLLVFLVLSRPDRYRVIRNLNLNDEEIQFINNPKAIISVEVFN